MGDKLTNKEVEDLRVKKKQIHEELYDKVKMEMFKASSALEGIEYEEPVVSPEKLKEIFLALDEIEEMEKKQRKKTKYKW